MKFKNKPYFIVRKRKTSINEGVRNIKNYDIYKRSIDKIEYSIKEYFKTLIVQYNQNNQIRIGHIPIPNKLFVYDFIGNKNILKVKIIIKNSRLIINTNYKDLNVSSIDLINTEYNNENKILFLYFEGIGTVNNFIEYISGTLKK